mgnify:CR=1 FL=1
MVNPIIQESYNLRKYIDEIRPRENLFHAYSDRDKIVPLVRGMEYQTRTDFLHHDQPAPQMN